MKIEARKIHCNIFTWLCVLPLCFCRLAAAESQSFREMANHYVAEPAIPLNQQTVTEFLLSNSPSFSPTIKSLYVNNGLFLSSDVSVDWRYSEKHVIKFQSQYKVMNAGKSSHLFNANYLWKITPKYKLNFKLRSKKSELDRRTSTYQLNYQMRPTPRQTITLTSRYKNTHTGVSTSQHSTTYRYALKIPHVSSNLQMYYENSPDVKTKVESSFQVNKRFTHLSGAPVKLAGILKWKKHETSGGNETTTVGGQISAAFNLSPNWTLNAKHRVEDQMSREFTSLESTYTTSFDGNAVKLKLGANNNNTVYINLESVL